ncbi:MAG: hypothetical protein DMF80_04985 [Acidobacteria bacterium]|nr:MAG: hypothetical protein DMF80_04985 [Acidobacteriota bacterium]
MAALWTARAATASASAKRPTGQGRPAAAPSSTRAAPAATTAITRTVFTAPHQSRTGIRSRQPAAAPPRSKRYSRLIWDANRAMASVTTHPAKKNGSAQAP